MLTEIKNNLQELGFSDNEIKVYVALTKLGESPAAIIAKKAGLPRTTTISILNKLADESYLSTHRYRGSIYYWIETPKTIQGILANKLAIAEQLGGMLTQLYRSETKFPFAHIYDTKKSIRNFIEKTLLNLKPRTIIYTIDTPSVGNYDKIFGEDFRHVFLNLKKQKSITTHTLIPYQTFGDISSKKLHNQNIMIREMPRGIRDFQASLWLIDGQVIFFSGKPPFLISIFHPVINPGIKSIYDFIWDISTPKT